MVLRPSVAKRCLWDILHGEKLDCMAGRSSGLIMGLDAALLGGGRLPRGEAPRGATDQDWLHCRLSHADAGMSAGL